MNELEINISPDYSEIKSGKLYLALDITIDGSNPLMSGNDDDFDIYELLNSWVDDNEDTSHFIFTCSCSCRVPGCAGYFKGISVKKLDDIVYWEDLDQENRYSFVRSKYQERLRKAAKEVMNWKKYADDRNQSLHIYPEWSDIRCVIELAKRLS